ncbi:hypothetical protein PV11_08638 [Exophiala sideris]|uniref:Uncharacterized protein n=1 Tax=Exophiala sideris TaxID=1016849 RepID=A0A0D1X155_9EURO|nr:hypothetical protein PV11_08638 [Exophiala sideris]
MSADLYAAFLDGGDGKGTSIDAAQSTSTGTERTEVPSSTLDYQRIPQSWTTTPKTGPSKQEPALWQKSPSGNDVLFDAEEPEIDDDFGDFQAVEDSKESGSQATQISENTHQPQHNIKAPTTAGLLTDFLDTDSYLQHTSASGGPRPGSKALEVTGNVPALKPSAANGTAEIDANWEEDWGEPEEIRPQTEPKHAPTGFAPQEKPQADPMKGRNDEEDDWEPFEDGQPATSAQDSPEKPSTTVRNGSQSVSLVSSNRPSFHERPTNVPPPSSLLQLLSDVFKSLHESNLDNTVSKPDLAAKILIVFRTACRLVAGRSLRWRRDNLLSQSMRISQAGKSGGMKLTSVNKSESAKEERDCREMIRDWDLHLHEFNSIIARAGLPPHRMKIPASAALKTLKYPVPTESSKQCALCGLKRVERVTDVDVDVDDLFGEFWTEHWGHKDCYDFWYSYTSLLGHR